MDNLRQDLGHALRSLSRSPGFALVAIVLLALGIGATTAMFSVVDSVLLRPLSYPDPGRLVWIDQPVPKYDADHPWGVSEAGYRDYAGNVPALARIGAFFNTDVDVARAGGARQVPAVYATASLLGVLGARPALGRLFGKAEDAPGGERVTLLGYGYWQRAFGGDPGVIGQTLRIGGSPATIIGVLARGFRLPRIAADLVLPAQLDPAATPVNSHYLGVVGRLAPGATLATANAQLARRVTGFTERYPQAYSPGFIRQFGFRAEAVPLRDEVLGNVSRGLWVLFGAVALVLLIACANVANLFLVRTEGRRRELAVRAALGAGRARLARSSLTESLVLTLFAGALGLWLASAAARLLRALGPTDLPRLAEVRVGWAGALFCAGIAAAAGVAFGLFPVLRRSVDLGLLREAGRGLSGGAVRRGARRALVAGQVALGVVLLAAGILLLRSFQRLRAVDPGFRAGRALTLEVALPSQGYTDYASTTAFWRQATSRIRDLPGVAAVGAGGALPVADGSSCAVLNVEDLPAERAGEARCVAKASVTPGYFAALGIPLRGRAPEWRDVDAGTGAVVVTRTLAERLWPGEEAIGRGLRGGSGGGSRYYRVVGVTGELRMDGLDRAPTPMVFFPVRPASDSLMLWGPPRYLTLVVRMKGGSSAALSGAIRRVLAGIDPDAAVGDVRTMAAVVSHSFARTTFILLLLGLAGAMALLLAAVGIYGVVAYLVERRTAEVGVRMALGATAARVGGMVVGESLATAALGAAVGLAVAVPAARLLASLLFEVSPADPLALGVAVAVLVVVAAAASLVPALRAARIDPARALRAE